MQESVTIKKRDSVVEDPFPGITNTISEQIIPIIVTRDGDWRGSKDSTV